eukprot:6174779-Pleurochrysis_carterae.AAC.1
MDILIVFRPPDGALKKSSRQTARTGHTLGAILTITWVFDGFRCMPFEKQKGQRLAFISAHKNELLHEERSRHRLLDECDRAVENVKDA